MSVYTLETLLRRWARGDLTPEQAIGQILQLVGKLQERIQDIENRLLRKEDTERRDQARSS